MTDGSNTLRTLIADDEPLARDALRLLLASHAEVEITGECRNVKEVISVLRASAIDLLFLDIQMPGSTGFEVFSEIGSTHMPITIFVTAHNSYALDAFGVHAFDYLTKPVEQERLDETMARVMQRWASDSALRTRNELNQVLSRLENSLQTAKDYPKRFLIRDGSKDAFVNVDDIEWIAAADYYSCLHVGRREYLLRDSIRNLATQLDPKKFVRIQRSALINIEHIKEIEREGRSEGWVILGSGQRLKMTKAGWQSLLAASQQQSVKT